MNQEDHWDGEKFSVAGACGFGGGKEKQKIWFDEIRLYSLFATKNNTLNKGILYCICVSERKQGLQTASKRK